MPQKSYDVSERFKEVARRANAINTGPTKKKVDTRGKNDVQPDNTRPGASMNIPRGKYGEKKDVNLPVETSPSNGFIKRMMEKRKK